MESLEERILQDMFDFKDKQRAEAYIRKKYREYFRTVAKSEAVIKNLLQENETAIRIFENVLEEIMKEDPKIKRPKFEKERVEIKEFVNDYICDYGKNVCVTLYLWETDHYYEIVLNISQIPCSMSTNKVLHLKDCIPKENELKNWKKEMELLRKWVKHYFPEIEVHVST